MDGYIHDVVIGIYDFQHRLKSVSVGHTHQPRKLTHAMIHMDDEVARLKLIKLLDGKRHLAAPCLVGAQIVLTETVEYLMVGKDAHLTVIVRVASVQRPVHSGKLDG